MAYLIGKGLFYYKNHVMEFTVKDFLKQVSTMQHIHIIYDINVAALLIATICK